MKKKAALAFLTVILVAVFVGSLTFNCMYRKTIDRLQILEERKAYLEWDIEGLAQQIVWLESEIVLLEEEWLETKLQTGAGKYVLTLEITHELENGSGLRSFLCGPVSMIVQIPVDKEYYDYVDVGDILHDDFKMGKFTWAGSSGDWKIVVKDKETMG